jgi:hypothetical protein
MAGQAEVAGTLGAGAVTVTVAAGLGACSPALPAEQAPASTTTATASIGDHSARNHGERQMSTACPD